MNADKTVHAENTPSPATRQGDQVPHEEIALRAEKLWRERNCPAGSDEEIWFEAESQLTAEAEARPVSGTESRPYVDEPGRQTRSHSRTQDPADSGVQLRSATEKKKSPPGPRLRNQ